MVNNTPSSKDECLDTLPTHSRAPIPLAQSNLNNAYRIQLNNILQMKQPDVFY